MTKVLVTGAGGYIGSHTVVALLEAGYQPVAFDSFERSKPVSLGRVQALTGSDFPVITADVRDADAVTAALEVHQPDCIIHFAGLKAVGESVAEPGRYYDVNVGGTRLLADLAASAGVKGLVFSSSATVYGDAEENPVAEDAPTGPTNPYGWSKYMAEQVLLDIAAASDHFRVANLRYFNPVGAHASGRIGEDPVGIPQNLLPFVAQVAVGMRERVQVHGNDYPTPDGTGVRDYIHVVDLAAGHVKAVDKLMQAPESFTVNLGSGRGYSVLEVLEAFRSASGNPVPSVMGPRRPGDVAELVANPSRAEALLNWKTERTLDDMCTDHWNWQQQNPRGYDDRQNEGESA